MTLDQAMARTGCLHCIPASQLWALLLINQAQFVVQPPTCFFLTCFDDGTDHEVCCILDQGNYTLDVTQTAGGSGAISGITFTASDLTVHVLQLRLDQGNYTLETVQTPGGSGAIASLPMQCIQDSTNRTITIVLDQGFYTWNIA